MPTEAEMRSLVMEAIFSNLGQAKRDELVKQALTGLLEPTPSTNYSSDRRSKLEIAYSDAVHVIAREEVSKALKENPEVRAKIQALVLAAFSKAMEGPPYEALVTNMAAGLAKAFKIESY